MKKALITSIFLLTILNAYAVLDVQDYAHRVKLYGKTCIILQNERTIDPDNRYFVGITCSWN